MTYVVGGAPPETVQVPARCAQEVAVGQPIPSCVQDAISAQFEAAAVEESTAAEVLEGTERIAFASERDGDTEIYTMRSDGTDVRQLTVNSWNEGQIAWPP